MIPSLGTRARARSGSTRARARSGRAWAFALCAAALFGRWAHAAEITDVADAFDTRQAGTQSIPDAWDLRLSTGWESIWVSGSVAREYIDGLSAPKADCTSTNSRGCGPVTELTYTRQIITQYVNIEAGLWHDIALTAVLPIVYNNTLKFAYAPGINAGTSSVDTGNANTTLFAHDFSSYHQGLGALGLGLRWGFLNDERDTSKPAVTFSFQWFNPATTHTNRLTPTSSYSPGNVGDGMHRLVFGLAFSKRVANFGDILVDDAVARRGYIDPYIELQYELPIPDNGFALSSLANTGDFGSRSPQIGRMQGGVEFVLHEDLATGSRFSIDLGMRGAYFSEARTYTAISEPLMRTTWSEQVFNISGSLGMTLQPARFFKLKLGGAAGYDTEHWLTNEIFGLAQAGTGTVSELNPYYCGNNPSDICAEKNLPSVDAVGFRFRERARTTLSAYVSIYLML